MLCFRQQYEIHYTLISIPPSDFARYPVDVLSMTRLSEADSQFRPQGPVHVPFRLYQKHALGVLGRQLFIDMYFRVACAAFMVRSALTALRAGEAN
jgi:hypothetical protein